MSKTLLDKFPLVLSCAFLVSQTDGWAQRAAGRPTPAAHPVPAQGAPQPAATDPGDPSPGDPTKQPVYFDQGLLVRSGETIQALGPDLMGDQINEYTGALSFSQTDVTVPGNSALAVAVGRRLVTGTQQAALKLGLFGDWDLALPYLRSVAMQKNPDWFGGDGYSQPFSQKRCSQLDQPPRSSYSAPYSDLLKIVGLPAEQWWDGHQLVVPGGGTQTLLRRVSPPANPIQPTDGTAYPVVTKHHWQFSCLTTLERGSGEGFLGLAPDGTRCRFDHFVQRRYPDFKPTPTGAAMGRIEFLLLPTVITDRFGNWVRYNYDNNGDGLRVARITSSDGRTITFGYNGWGNRLGSVSDGTRTWFYSYDSSGALQAVALPDGSKWYYNLADLEREPPIAPDMGCGNPPVYQWDSAIHYGVIVHPSGAQGNFQVRMTQHGRTVVPGTEEGCEGVPAPQNLGNLVSRYFNDYALVNKALSGPGMPDMFWTYSYSSAIGRFNSEDPNPGTKTVRITDPNGNLVEKTFGTGWGLNEGLLLTNVVYAGTQQPLQTTSYSYARPDAGPYPSSLGVYTTTRSDVMNTIFTPQTGRVITQQGVTMTQTIGGFDVYARAGALTRSSLLGYSRSESTVYADNTRLWVLGQVASTTAAGIVAAQTDYDANTALPLRSYKFGKLQASYGFNADGTLASVTDGLNHTTSFRDYVRGLPRRITYADWFSHPGAAGSSVGCRTSALPMKP